MKLTYAEQELVAYMAGNKEKAFSYALLDDANITEENKQTVEALQARISYLENENAEANRQLKDSDAFINSLKVNVVELNLEIIKLSINITGLKNELCPPWEPNC